MSHSEMLCNSQSTNLILLPTDTLQLAEINVRIDLFLRELVLKRLSFIQSATLSSSLRVQAKILLGGFKLRKNEP